MATVTGFISGSGYRTPHNIDPRLREYLNERDYGIPSLTPGIDGKVEIPSGNGAVLCEIRWLYEQVVPPNGIPCDGFIIWIGYRADAGQVPEPTILGTKVSEGCRAYVFPVPPGIAARFGIQAYRETHQGEFRGPKLWPDEWICDNRDTCTAVRFHLPLRPVPDGVTREFFPIDPSTGDEIIVHVREGGIWQGTLNYRRGPWPLQPIAVAPFEPDVGYWTGNDNNRVRFNENDVPQPGDFLEFEVATVC